MTEPMRRPAGQPVRRPAERQGERTVDRAVEHSRWWPLRLLLDAMAAEIARVYTDARVEGLKPSWVMELLTLDEHGPMTITQLAEAVERTHSAMSQKVAAMTAAGFVRTKSIASASHTGAANATARGTIASTSWSGSSAARKVSTTIPMASFCRRRNRAASSS